MAPLTIQQAFDLALQYHQSGRLREAEQLYRQILTQQPQHTGAMQNLGMLAHQVGRNDDAVDLIRRAIALCPGDAQAYGNLGNALKGNGQLDQAITAYRRAIELRPDYAQAHNNLGVALIENSQLDQAIVAFRQAIESEPAYADAHYNLGNAHRDNGQFDEAAAAYRQAIALRPRDAEPHIDLGNILRNKGQLDEAITEFRQSITLRPTYADAHYNLANTLRDKGQLDEAIAAYRQAIALRPNFAQAHNNLGLALGDQGQLDEAMAAYRQAVALQPSYVNADSNLIFALHYHPAYDAPAIAEELRRWNERHAQPLQQFILPHRNDTGLDRRLRVGYVSPDFRDHVVGRNLLPWFHQHDRRQFEITCYANVHRPDAMTREFQQTADCWRNIVGLSDEQAVEQIRADHIDVLVDLALHTANNRLLIFAYKPAPVQATFAGYPGSTGLTTIDYRLSDPYLDPAGMDESIYSERTIRLPDSFWCYDPLDNRKLSVNSLPALETGFITFGCLNNFCKVSDKALILWAQVLRQVEGSRLVLLARQGSHRQRTMNRLGEEGIHPERIEFVPLQPRRPYLELYHRIDIGLDSFPYNGHTTSLDSIWMGVPVVSLVGQTAVSRAGWSQLSNLGLAELAGKSEEQFVRIAVRLAGDFPRLQALRSTLRRRMERSPLMDGPRFARNIEAAYRGMWQTWCQSAHR